MNNIRKIPTDYNGSRTILWTAAAGFLTYAAQTISDRFSDYYNALFESDFSSSDSIPQHFKYIGDWWLEMVSSYQQRSHFHEEE